MDWIAKLEVLRGGRSLAQIERDAGWSLNSLSAAISNEALPTAKKAVMLARALGVTAEWLFDDSQELPPPSRGAPPVAITPWPPHGITWEEVQLAISSFITQRTQAWLRRENEKLAGTGVELVIGEGMPIDPKEAEEAMRRRKGRRK